jgi:ketopantoate reductase
MLQDVLRGSQTEIDAICGAVVRHGRLAGIPTPINAEFLRLIQALSFSSPGEPLVSKLEPLQALLEQRKGK